MRITKTTLAILAAGALAACSGGDDGPAVQLFGTTSGASQLLELDPTTGALIRTIGAVGYQVNGLEYDRSTGKLFATTSTNDPSFPDGLIQINLTTGAGTPVGEGAGLLVNNPTVNAAGQMFAWTEDSDNVVTFDKATGVATVVGESGVSTYEHGLAFDGDGTLWFVNGNGETYTIDTVSGGATLAGDIGVMAHHGDVHPLTGEYWGIDTTPSYGTDVRNFVIVDLDTVEVDRTIATVDKLFAITFR